MQANLSLAGGLEPRPGWRNDPEESPAGSMCGLGVHMVDNLQFLAGPAKRVSAFSKKLLSKTNLDDVTSFIIEYESGPLGYIGTTFVVPKICETSAFGTGMNAYSDLEGTKLYITKAGDDKKEEIDLILNHHQDSADISVKFQGVPLEVDTIIKQHHEINDGICASKPIAEVSLFSAIFIICHDLADYIFFNTKWTVNDFILEKKGDYTKGSLLRVYEEMDKQEED